MANHRETLTLAQQMGLAAVKMHGYVPGRAKGRLHTLLEASGLIVAVHRPGRPYMLSEAGEKALQRAIADAEAKAATALGNANEMGRPSPKYEASAQKWLDIANDLRGQGS